MLRPALVLLLAVLVSPALVGCAQEPPKTVVTPVVIGPPPVETACLVMSSVMPQRVSSEDTRRTREDAYVRNTAWHVACPALSQAKPPATALVGDAR